jgi:hypothetical protein
MSGEPPPKKKPEIGDIQVDLNGSEWVVVGTTTRSVSRVRRYSLAHQVHSEGSPRIAESLVVTDVSTEE